MFECVNCGQENNLGDCCPDCAMLECDNCYNLIPLDEDMREGDPPSILCLDCYIKSNPDYSEKTDIIYEPTR